jgi:hypothetical protein
MRPSRGTTVSSGCSSLLIVGESDVPIAVVSSRLLRRGVECAVLCSSLQTISFNAIQALLPHRILEKMTIIFPDLRVGRRRTIWGTSSRAYATYFRRREIARICATLPLAIGTWLFTIALDFSLFAKITCCRNSIDSTALLWRLRVTCFHLRCRRHLNVKLFTRNRCFQIDGAEETSIEAVRVFSSVVAYVLEAAVTTSVHTDQLDHRDVRCGSRTLELRNVRVTPGADIVVGRKSTRWSKFRHSVSWHRSVIGWQHANDLKTLRLAEG